MSLWSRIRSYFAPPNTGQLTPHFHLREFHCYNRRDSSYALIAQYPKRWRAKRLAPLVAALEVIRAEAGSPCEITSAYRTVAYNRRVGGVVRSQHPQGRAVDFHCDLPHEELYNLVVHLISTERIPQGGVGLYVWGVHYDQRKPVQAARWRGKGV